MNLTNQQGWLCYQCNLYNDILTVNCRDCSANRKSNLDSAAIITFFKRGLCELKMSTDKTELHIKFYNHEKSLYSVMDLMTRQSHRNELASLIFEARARMNAVDDIDREDRAKLSPTGKEWLTTNSDVTSSNALNEPKVRKERQSKADKLKEQMLSLGMSLTDVNKIIGQVESVATEKTLSNITFTKSNGKPLAVLAELCRVEKHSDCTGSFRDESGSYKCECKCHDEVKPISEDKQEIKPSPVFDPSKLFG